MRQNAALDFIDIPQKLTERGRTFFGVKYQQKKRLRASICLIECNLMYNSQKQKFQNTSTLPVALNLLNSFLLKSRDLLIETLQLDIY